MSTEKISELMRSVQNLGNHLLFRRSVNQLSERFRDLWWVLYRTLDRVSVSGYERALIINQQVSLDSQKDRELIGRMLLYVHLRYLKCVISVVQELVFSDIRNDELIHNLDSLREATYELWGTWTGIVAYPKSRIDNLYSRVLNLVDEIYTNPLTHDMIDAQEVADDMEMIYNFLSEGMESQDTGIYWLLTDAVQCTVNTLCVTDILLENAIYYLENTGMVSDKV